MPTMNLLGAKFDHVKILQCGCVFFENSDKFWSNSGKWYSVLNMNHMKKCNEIRWILGLDLISLLFLWLKNHEKKNHSTIAINSVAFGQYSFLFQSYLEYHQGSQAEIFPRIIIIWPLKTCAYLFQKRIFKHLNVEFMCTVMQITIYPGLILNNEFLRFWCKSKLDLKWHHCAVCNVLF